MGWSLPVSHGDTCLPSALVNRHDWAITFLKLPFSILRFHFLNLFFLIMTLSAHNHVPS